MALASGLLLLGTIPLPDQAPPSVTAACASVQGIPTRDLLERERLASYDVVGKTKLVSFWRELGCSRAAVIALRC